MVPTRVFLLIAFAVLVAAARPAHAQTDAPLGGCTKWLAESLDARNVEITRTTVLIKDVHIDCNDVQLFADHAELFRDIDRIRATGNVVFVSGTSRIAAERMEFNTRTKTGTFFNASGIANLENRGVERSLFGSQEPDAYFYGETIEKLGPKTYKISKGGFTTCVQPTPRWEMVATTVTLTLEKRAVMTNMVLKVKEVPLFYLPAMYYPINKSDRATGFLLPIYSTSTIKGQTISNAFFWAINRSQDATLYHSFYSKTGQSFGGDYRYVQSGASSGSIQTSILREHAAEYDQPDGTTKTFDGVKSFQITGALVQALPGKLRLSASSNYFSSLVAQQRYQQDVYQATLRTRTFGGNISGNWDAHSLSATIDRNEVFTNDTDSNVVGSAPKVVFSRAEKSIGKLPLYWGATTEFASLIRTDKAGEKFNERGLRRFDVSPTLRFPFTKLPYLTFNSSLGFRQTFWSESLAPDGLQVPESINRHYFTMATTITGPVMTRIWNTPRKTYAQKFKHVIEPSITLARVTPFDNYDRIVKLESHDYDVGRVTSIAYGINNRLYAKKESAREILSVAIGQSYHTDQRAVDTDRQYQSSDYKAGLKPTHFTPVAMQVHVSPTTVTDATFRTEYDTQVHALRSLAANGGVAVGWAVANAGWSLNRFIPELGGSPSSAAHYLNASTVVRKPGNAFSGTYAFNYDIKLNNFLNQRVMVHYNSQCCGIAVEYQKFNFGTRSGTVGVPKDKRFNLSFTLAGIGTFSDLFGAFGGPQGR